MPLVKNMMSKFLLFVTVRAVPLPKLMRKKIIRKRMFGMVEPWIRNHKPGIRLIEAYRSPNVDPIGKTFPRSGKSKRQLKFSNLYGNFRLRR